MPEAPEVKYITWSLNNDFSNDKLVKVDIIGGRYLKHGLPGLFRTQKGWGPLRTRMQTTPGPHEGLGLDYYAWCTSPLRRYSDLVNQWQLNL